MNKLPRSRTIAGIGATLAIAAFGLAIPVLTPAPAKAFVAFSFGFPIGFPAYPPPPPYYYPPPPPPGYYPPPDTSGPLGAYPPAAAQPPASHPSSGYAPSPMPSITYTPRRAWTDASGRQCREYTTSREVEGHATKIYGTACRDLDGQWRIVN
jgi:17 kDa outer membrane surface antigen